MKRFPALPFPYYDPWKRSYEVTHSAPVPMTVRDVRTVRPEDSVGLPGGDQPGGPGLVTRRLGIGANFESLGDTDGRLVAAAPLFSPLFGLLLLGPLVAAGLFVFAARRAERPKDAVRGSPLARALVGLTGDVEGAAAAFGDYFRERLELGAGEITAREVARGLTARSVASEVVSRVERIYAGLTQARFAGGHPPAEIGDVLREVDRCLG